MKEIKNIYGMPKKSWKRFCDSKNTIKQRRENKEARKNRFKRQYITLIFVKDLGGANKLSYSFTI